MTGLFSLNEFTTFSEPEEPEYNVTMSGMTPDALFSRYIDLSDECVEMEMLMSYDEPNDEDETTLNAIMAKMHSVASIAFIPAPVLPFFPWKAPVR